MDNKENSLSTATPNKFTLLFRDASASKPFNPQLLLKTHENKAPDSMSFSLERECMGSSKSSAVFMNEPITHNDGSSHSTANTQQATDKPNVVKAFGVRSRERERESSNSSSKHVEAEPPSRPTSVGRTSAPLPDISTAKFIEMKVKCKEWEFECASLREALKEHQQRELTGDHWRTNKLN